MKIAVLGGDGFIGERLVRHLLEEGHDVAVGDLTARCNPERTRRCDVRDADSVRAVCQGADVIYNLAAEHRDDVRPLSLYDEVNVDGARVVSGVADELGISTLVFTSSVAIYGLPQGEPDEAAAPVPFNDYGRTKLEAERVYEGWLQADAGRRLIVVRPTVVFGEGNRGNVYNLLRQLARGPSIMIGDGGNRKSMAYVGNVVGFLSFVLGLPVGHHVYNYVDKPDLEVGELVRLARGALGKRPHPRLRVPYRVALTGATLFDGLARVSGRRFPISRVRIRKFCANTRFSSQRMLASGFEPPFDLRTALERTIAHEFGG